MKTHRSALTRLGPVSLPQFSGTRILMMPFQMHNLLGSLPDGLHHWVPALRQARSLIRRQHGTFYLTIDESVVQPGTPQRRPGLHVDGWHVDGTTAGGSWGGGGGGSWGGGGGGGGGGGWGGGSQPIDTEPEPATDSGMVVFTSHLGSRAWNKEFTGDPAEFGDCEHLRDQFPDHEAIPISPGFVYHMTGMTVHEAVPTPVRYPVSRQFVRISFPNKSVWPSSCTPNPRGTMPDGPIGAPRPEQFTQYGSQHQMA